MYEAIIEELKSCGAHTIILYGSRARGDFNSQIDVDMIAFRDKGESFLIARWDEKLKCYLDIFVETFSTFNESYFKLAEGVINISSLADRVSRPNLAVYAATKAAVKSLSESLRAANAKYGIQICNVAPAKIQTPLLKNSSLKQNEVISVADFAKIIFWITQQPKEICVRDIVIAPTKYEA